MTHACSAIGRSGRGSRNRPRAGHSAGSCTWTLRETRRETWRRRRSSAGACWPRSSTGTIWPITSWSGSGSPTRPTSRRQRRGRLRQHACRRPDRPRAPDGLGRGGAPSKLDRRAALGRAGPGRRRRPESRRRQRGRDASKPISRCAGRSGPAPTIRPCCFAWTHPKRAVFRRWPRWQPRAAGRDRERRHRVALEGIGCLPVEPGVTTFCRDGALGRSAPIRVMSLALLVGCASQQKKDTPASSGTCTSPETTSCRRATSRRRSSPRRRAGGRSRPSSTSTRSPGSLI